MDVSYNFVQKLSHQSLKSPHSVSFGFSLLELLITLTISSIVLSFAIPELRTMFKLNQNATIINSLIADFAYSRSEAIKRRRDVVICKSVDGLTCTSNSSWQDGWILFVDDDKSDRIRSSEEPLLKVQQALGSNIKIKFSSFNRKNKIVYRSSGVADYSNGTFYFCSNNEQYHKNLILSRTGRTYLKVNPGPVFNKSKSC